jgi:hypothetical protein
MEVPRAEVVELLGLPADVSDEDLGRALTKALESAGERALVSAAEGQARAEDRTIVVAAVNEGRVHPTRIQFWLDALQRDRAGCRQVIASLVPGLKPAVPIEDPDVEVARQGVMASLKRMGVDPPPRQVAAAVAPLPPPGVVVDSIAGSLSQIPPPVRLTSGKPPETWSKRERDDAFIHAAFPMLRGAVPKPPGGEGVYLPSPNQPRLPVQLPNGDVEWYDNPNARSVD